MNNFYASVECMLDPALRKYPVAVCGSVEERHGIVPVSYTHLIVTRNGDTLEEDWPYFDENDPVNTYNPLYVDAVVSNPPYSQAVSYTHLDVYKRQPLYQAGHWG